MKSPSDTSIALERHNLEKFQEFLKHNKYADALDRWNFFYDRMNQLSIETLSTFLELTHQLANVNPTQDELYEKLLHQAAQWQSHLKPSALLDYYHKTASFYEKQNQRDQKVIKRILGYRLKAYRLAEAKGLTEWQVKIAEMLDHYEVRYTLDIYLNRLHQAWEALSNDKTGSFEDMLSWLLQLQQVGNQLSYAQTSDLLDSLYKTFELALEECLTRFKNYLQAQCQSSIPSDDKSHWQKNTQAFEKAIAIMQPVFEGFKRHHRWALLIEFYSKAILHDDITKRLKKQNYQNDKWHSERMQIEQAHEIATVDWLTYKSLWQDHRTQLASLRSTFTEKFRTGTSVTLLQRNFTQAIITFLHNILHYCQSTLGAPPCAFHVINIGSASRQALAPYSDIDFAILITTEKERKHPYFGHFVQLFNLTLNLLGEAGLLRIGKDPALDDEAGLHLESADLSYFDLANQNNNNDDNLLLNTPKKLVELLEKYDILLNSKTDKAEATRCSLYRPSSLYASLPDGKIEGGNTLLQEFYQHLQRCLEIGVIAPVSLSSTNESHNEKFALTQPVYSALALRFLKDDERSLDWLNVRSELGIAIKQHYMAPLSRWILNIALYFGIYALDPETALYQLEQQHYLTTTFVTTLQKTLELFYRLRIEAHITANCQHDNVYTQADSAAPSQGKILTSAELQALQHHALMALVPLQHIITLLETSSSSLVLPLDPTALYLNVTLANYLDTSKSTKRQTMEQAITILALSLHAQQAKPAVYRQYYMHLPERLRDLLLQQISVCRTDNKERLAAIMRVLESYPAQDGRRPALDHADAAWQNNLQTLLPTKDQETLSGSLTFFKAKPIKVMLQTPALGAEPLPLNKLLVDALLTAQGEFKGISLPGRHIVIPITHDQQHVHCKLYPEFPGIEYAVGRLHELVMGGGTAQTALSKVIVGQKAYPVLISNTVHGQPLHQVLKDESNEWLSQLDHKHFSQLVLMALLVNPEDGKPDNYIREPYKDADGTTRYRLIGIDNDHAFVKSVVETKWHERGALKLQTKTILFCFDPMKQPLHVEAIEEFLALDPFRLLSTWLMDLIAWDKGANKLFTAAEQIQLLQNKEDLQKTVVATLLPPNTVQNLYQTLYRLQALLRDLRDLLRDTPDLTAIELLTHIDPLLASFYADSLQEVLSPGQRFMKITANEYKVLPNGSSLTALNTLQTLNTLLGALPKAEVLVAETAYKPDRHLDDLHLIHQHVKSLDAVKDDLVKDNTQPFTDLILDIFREQIINRIQWSSIKTREDKPDIAIQQRILKACVGTSFRVLKLKDCAGLTAQLLADIVNGSPSLRKLDVSGSIALGNSILLLLSRCRVLEKLTLNRLPQLTQINITSGLFGDMPFPQLRYLTVKDCKKLVQVRLEAMRLATLSLSDCTMLAKITLKTPLLTYVDFSQCSAFDETSFAGGWNHHPAIQAVKLTGCEHIEEYKLKKQVPGWLGKDLKTIFKPQTLDELKSILSDTTTTSLDLSWNQIGDTGAQALADMLKGNTTLTTLNLRSNKIGDAGAQALANMLKGNTTLATLYLSYNQIGAAGAQALADMLKGNTTLTTLNLWGNQISEAGAQALANMLKGNTTLTTLDLSYNQIGAAGAQALADTLKGNTTLTTLGLRHNQIGAAGAQALADMLKGNTTLTTLDLSYNQIGDAGAQALADMLKGNMTLTTLDLSYNQIGDAGAQALADMLKGNMTLTTLDLYFKEIGEEIEEKIKSYLKRNHYRQFVISSSMKIKSQQDQEQLNTNSQNPSVLSISTKDSSLLSSTHTFKPASNKAPFKFVSYPPKEKSNSTLSLENKQDSEDDLPELESFTP